MKIIGIGICHIYIKYNVDFFLVTTIKAKTKKLTTLRGTKDGVGIDLLLD